jgi:hypothetical protein
MEWDLNQLAVLPAEQVLHQLKTHTDGLTPAEARSHLPDCGPNDIALIFYEWHLILKNNSMGAD